MYVPLYSANPTFRILRITTKPFAITSFLDTGTFGLFLTSFIEASEKFLYVVTEVGFLVEVDLDQFPASSAITRTIDLRTLISPLPTQANFFASAYDPTTKMAYLGEIKGTLAKINIQTFSVVASFTLPALPGRVRTVSLDIARQNAYFATLATACGTSGAVIARVNMATFTLGTSQIASYPDYHFVTSILDAKLGYLYLSTSCGFPTVSKIVRLRLNETAMDIRPGTDEITLTKIDEINIVSAVLINNTHRGFFGTDEIAPGVPSRVIGIDLAKWVYTGSAQMNPGETSIAAGVSNEQSGDFFMFNRKLGHGIQYLLNPPPCNMTTCKTCNEGCSCGWCAASQTCMAGDLSGSFSGVCSAGLWDFPSCAQCSVGTTCATCLAISGNVCGWCGKTNTCLRGSSAGPYAATCPAGSWSFTACPNCAVPTTCDTCTSTSFPGCGYCASTATCQAGDFTGPYAVNCTGWRYGTSGPQTCANCAAYTTCADCTADARCGYCGQDGICVEGSTSGPFGFTCPSWNYNTCPACAAQTSCDTCLAKPECGWCASRGVCTTGGATGPFGDTCPGGSLAWDFGSCRVCGGSQGPSAPCSTCLSTTCGYCAATRQCVRGDATTAFPPATCGTAGAWFFASGTCPNCTGSCLTCSATTGCGWCEAQGACLPGTTQGDYTGTCTVATGGWLLDPTTCPTCARHGTNCSACVGDPGCGFCYQDGTCQSGNAGGSFQTCNNTGNTPWIGGVPVCPAICQSTNCFECTRDTRCGWCPSTQKCSYGLANGPLDGATCTSGWLKTCPPCASVVTCNTCTSYGCGFCDQTRNCSVGNSTGPLFGMCESSYSYGKCNAPIVGSNCYLFTDCESCTSIEACGWCHRGFTCKARTDSSCADELNIEQCPNYGFGLALAILLLLLLVGLFLCCFLMWYFRVFLFKERKVQAAKPSLLEDPTVKPTVEAPIAESPEKAPEPVAPARREIFLNPPPYALLASRDSDISKELGEILAEFERLVLHPNQYIVRALCDVVQMDSPDADLLSAALVSDFEANQMSISLVKSAVSHEVRQTKEGNVTSLFGKNSMTARLMRDYSAIMGMPYLFYTLRPETLAVLKRKDFLEHNPHQLKPVVARFLMDIQASEREFPAPLRTLCQHIMKEVEEAFPGMQTRAVGGFVFLRFLDPAVHSPISYGVVQDFDGLPAPITELQRKNLISVCKVLQAIASQASFRNKNLHLAVLNPWVGEEIPPVERLLTSLASTEQHVGMVPVRSEANLHASPPSSPPASPKNHASMARLNASAQGIEMKAPPVNRDDLKVTAPTSTPPHVRDEALFVLYSLALKYLEELRERLGANKSFTPPPQQTSRQKPFDKMKNAVMQYELDFETLMRMLIADDFALVSALCDVSKQEEHPDLCHALLLLFTSAQDTVAHHVETPPEVPAPTLCLALVKILANRELRTCAEPNMVFRGIHVCAQFMTLYSTLVGGAYRRRILSPIVAEILDRADSFEIDPARIKPGYNLKDNLVNLLDITGNLLEAIFNSLDSCPVQFRTIADYLTTIVGDRYPDHWFVGPGRFFFTHFICEGLAHPEKHGISDTPSVEARRVLQQINKIVVHMVNAMQFGVEHKYMRNLNEFMGNNTGVMQDFLIELSRIPEDATVAATQTPFTPAQEDEAVAYVCSRLRFYIENADFCYYYHFYYFYHTDMSDEEDGGGVGATSGAGGRRFIEPPPEVLAFRQLEEIVSNGEDIREALTGQRVMLVETEVRERGTGER